MHKNDFYLLKEQLGNKDWFLAKKKNTKTKEK